MNELDKFNVGIVFFIIGVSMVVFAMCGNFSFTMPSFTFGMGSLITGMSIILLLDW